MTAACNHFGIPVTGGNVSFYNETEGEGVYPTPVIGVVGLMKAKHRLSHAFKSDRDAIYLLGTTRDEMGASEYFEALLRTGGWLRPATRPQRGKGVAGSRGGSGETGLAETRHTT